MNQISYIESTHGNVVYDALQECLSIQGNVIADGANTHIQSITIFSKTVVVVFDDADLHGKSVADSYVDKRKGNIVCYSMEEKPRVLWRIDDLCAGQIHLPFCAGHSVTLQEQLSWSKWHDVEFQRNHEYFLALNYGGGKYLIDVTAAQLLKIIYSKD